jgi:hypothetical protein
MALSNPNAVWLGTGPTQTGQILSSGGSDRQRFAYSGTCESTGGDGSDVAFIVGLIDGTKTLPFTPSAVMISRIPATTGANEAASSIVGSVSAIDNATFTVTLSAAPASGKDIKFGFIALK